MSNHMPHVAPRHIAKPKLEQLEAREVPAVFSVYLFTPGAGIVGDTAATISGSLTMRPDLERDPGGAVYVETDTAAAAAAQVITGSVTVQWNGASHSYSFNSGTVGQWAGQSQPFLVSSNAIRLEDMAGDPNGCDYDYNDRTWLIDIRELSENAPLTPHPMEVPITYGDYYAGDEDAVLSVAAADGLLINDQRGGATIFDPENPLPPGAGLTAVLVEGPGDGTLGLQSNGAFLYTPNADFSGFDYFKYRVTDGVNISFNAYVQLNVRRVIHDEMVALDDFAERDPGAGVSGDVLLNDTDHTGLIATVALETGPSHGTVALTSTGGFTYTPTPGGNAADSFAYRVTNSAGKIGTATVFIAGEAPAEVIPVGTYRTLSAGAAYAKPSNVTDDPGAGEWGSETGWKQIAKAGAKKLVIGGLVGAPVPAGPFPWSGTIVNANRALELGMPDAAKHMGHFVGNSGTDWDIDMTSLLKVKSAKAL